MRYLAPVSSAADQEKRNRLKECIQKFVYHYEKLDPAKYHLSTLEKFNNYRNAYRYCNEGFFIAEQLGDKTEQYEFLYDMGRLESRGRNTKKATKAYEKALNFAVKEGYNEKQINCYLEIGRLHYLTDVGKAIESYEKALRITEGLENKLYQIDVLISVIPLYIANGQVEKAINSGEYVWSLVSVTNETHRKARICLILGNSYSSAGWYDKAVVSAEKGLPLANAVDDKNLEAGLILISNCARALSLFYSSGKDYVRLGKFYTEQVIADLEKGLKLADQSNDIPLQVKFANLLVGGYLALEQDKKAAEVHNMYMSRLANFMKSSYSRKWPFSKLKIGDQSFKLDALKEMVKLLQQPLDLESENNNENSETEREKDLKFEKFSIDIFKAAGNVAEESFMTSLVAKDYSEFDPSRAYQYLKRSIELRDFVWEKIATEETKIAFYGHGFDPYDFMIGACLKLNKFDEAFQYSEKSRSKTFLKILSEKNIQPKCTITDELANLLSEEKKYYTELDELKNRKARQKIFDYLTSDEANIIREKLQEIYRKISKFDPEYAEAKTGASISLEELRSELLLDDKTTLVEYYLSNEYEETIIFIIRNNHMKAVRSKLSYDILKRFASDYKREVAGYPKYGDIGNSWLELSEYLVSPIASELQDSKKICFIPHGLLHYLPLHVLELDDLPLIKNHPISYSPSASVLKYIHKDSNVLETCKSFGVDFNQEASEIAAIYNSTPCLNATKKNVVESIMGNDILHFSCHGFFNYENPMASGLKLYDGFLDCEDILKLTLKAELVTLSACDTGISENKPGEELIGLMRSFLYAGTNSLIVSLWPVDPSASLNFMKEFYTFLRANRDKPSAMQQAQIKIMNKSEYSHPYYWAPYILTGNWD